MKNSEQPGDEEMISKCIEAIRDTGKATISLLQRRLRLGYIEATRLMNILEQRGIVGPSEYGESGTRPRAIIGLPPISETSEEKPLFKSDDEMLMALTGSAKEVVLKNPDGSTWTPSAPAAPAPAGDEATPRTDAHYRAARLLFESYSTQASKNLDFARTLELELSASRREVVKITREKDAAVHWASKLSKALITTDECVGTAADQLHAANRENDSLRAQLTSIGDEIEAINKSREEQAVNLAKVSRENEELKSQLATVTAERDEVAEITAKYEAEKAIVSRIWKQLGCQTYEDAKGKSIYEWVQDGIEATKQLGTTAEQLQATVAESKVLHDAFDFEQSRAAAHVSRARTAEAALASVREMWAVLPTNDMIHYDNCACFQCSVRKVLSDDAGQSLLDELEKAKKDGARLDWLETMAVNVRQPLVYGSRDLFWAAPEDDDGNIIKPELRSQIDAAIAQKEAK